MTRLLLSLSIVLLFFGFTIPRMFDEGMEAQVGRERQQDEFDLALDVVSDDLPDRAAPIGMSFAGYTARVRTHGDLFGKYLGGVTTVAETMLEFPEGTDITTAVVLCYGDFGTAPESTYEGLVESLSQSSDAVVLGRIEAKTSYFSSDKSFVYTEYNMKVLKTYKSDPRDSQRFKDSVIVVGPGGSIRYKGRVCRVHIKNLRPYRSGETEYLLFLRYVPETGAYVAIEPYSSFALLGDSVQNTTVESHFGDLNIDRNSLLRIVDNAANPH